MSRIGTAVRRDETFEANTRAQRTLVAELKAHLERIRAGGSESARARHTQRGRLLVRERIERVLDPGSPFLELMPFAAEGLYGESVPAGGLVIGIGVVQGHQTMVIANDVTVKGGTLYPITVQKQLRAQQIAEENRLIGRFMQALRRRRLSKAPGVAETIDWAQALLRLHREHLDLETVEQTLGCIVKDHHDVRELGGGGLETALAEAVAG